MIDLTNGLPKPEPKEGFTRSGIHTKEFNMWLVERQAPSPSEKEIIETVPFMQGSYDFSDLLGERVFENRNLIYVFEVKEQDYKHRKVDQTVIENWLKKDGMAPLFDDHARGYFYMAKCLNVTTEDQAGGLRATIEFTAYPFKISELEEGHDIWDEINFELDVLQPVEFEIEGSRQINLINVGSNSISPTIIASESMTIEKDLSTFDVPKGESQSESFRLAIGSNLMTITGNGSIEFKWRKELL